MTMCQWTEQDFTESGVAYRRPAWLQLVRNFAPALALVLFIAIPVLPNDGVVLVATSSAMLLAVSAIAAVLNRILRTRHYSMGKASGYQLARCADLFAKACQDKELLDAWIRSVGHTSWIRRCLRAIAENSEGVHVCQMSEDTVLEFIDSWIRKKSCERDTTSLRAGAHATSQ